MTSRVGIVMGSASDKPVMQHAADTLTGLGVESETRVLSAHRTPDALRDWVTESEKRGTKVFIAGAGAAAHLPGVVASITTRPVIGVPLIAPNSFFFFSSRRRHTILTCDWSSDVCSSD